jgi:threonine/homoserine/homoserine lactone efflux protein
MFNAGLVFGLFALNIATPGVSFFLIASNSLTYGRRIGLWVVLGLVAADVVLSSAAIGGLATLLAYNVNLRVYFRLLGGLWLSTVGLRMIMRCRQARREGNPAGNQPTAGAAVGVGCITGLLNVQTFLFFSTVLFQHVAARPNLLASGIMVAGITLVSVIVRSGIACMFTLRIIHRIFWAHCRKLEVAAGMALTAFGSNMVKGLLGIR